MLRAVCRWDGGPRPPMACVSSPCRVHWPKRTSPAPKQTRMTREGEKSREMLLPKWSWHLAPTIHPSLILTRWTRSKEHCLLPALDAENHRARKPVSVTVCQRGSWVFLSAAHGTPARPTFAFRSPSLSPLSPSLSVLPQSFSPHRLPMTYLYFSAKSP